MKNLFLILFALILLFGCSTQDPEVKTETIIVHEKEFVYSLTKTVDPAYSLIYPYEPEITPAYASFFDLKTLKSIFVKDKTFAFMTDYYADPSIYELTTNGGNGYVDVEANHIIYDFETCGYLYYNNSYNCDTAVHEFDLSGAEYCNGIKSAVYIKITQIDADKSGISGHFAFRPHGSDYIWQDVYVNASNPALTLQLTGETGIIDWKQLCGEPYDKKTILGDPEYHDYCRTKYTMEVEKILQ